MKDCIADILIAFTAELPKEDAKPIGHIDNSVFLWYLYTNTNKMNAITDIDILYDNSDIPEGYEKINIDLNRNKEDSNMSIYLIIQRNESASPLVDIKLYNNESKYVPTGYKQSANLLNPNDINKLRLISQTQDTFKKLQTNDYEVGDRCDCLDGSTWRTARVLETRMNSKYNVKELYLNFDNDQVEVSDANIYSGLCECLVLIL